MGGAALTARATLKVPVEHGTARVAEFGDVPPGRVAGFRCVPGARSREDESVATPDDGNTGHPHRPLKRLNFNGVAGLVFTVAGAALFFITPYQVEKPVIVFGQSLNALDPTLFPRIVAVGVFGLGIWLFFKSFSLTERNGFRELDREAYVNVAVSVVAFTLYALLMEPLGFILSSILLVGGLSFFYGIRNLVLIGAVSIVVPVAIYFVFTRALQVFLPEFPAF